MLRLLPLLLLLLFLLLLLSLLLLSEVANIPCLVVFRSPLYHKNLSLPDAMAVVGMEMTKPESGSKKAKEPSTHPSRELSSA